MIPRMADAPQPGHASGGERHRVLAVAQAPALGGAELALVRLARLLPERGFDVAATVPAPGPLRGALQAEGVESAKLPVGELERGRWLGALAGWPRARAALDRFGPDIVWLNGVVTMRAAPAFRRARALVPYLHDLLENSPRPWRSKRFWEQTPVVMCASQAVADHAEAAGAPAGRLRVVWAPVERLEPVPKPDWAANGGPVVGYVGRIEPRKGTLDLLQAFPALLERWPRARLVIVGEPELGAPADYAQAVADAASALGESVRMLGRVERAPALMPWFDVLAVPSANEPFGTVAAEALAAGTPVVATRSGGMEEYVRPGVDGELVPPGDPAALADALDAVVARASDSVASARADAGRFDPALVADAVADCFNEALAATR
jgi:glycosyltransferase involved in cell wall biosynthesis